MQLRYNLRHLLVSITLVSAGAGMLAYLFGPKLVHEPLHGWHWMVWFAAGAFIGTGVLYPLQRPILGAVLGLCVQVVLWQSMGVIWT